MADRGDQSAGDRQALRVVAGLEDVMHYAVAAFLLAMGVYVLAHSVYNFVHTGPDFAHRVTNGVNGVLFVIIVMEILRTVLAHFDDAGLQLKPFLIIGIISAVRHLLTVGAQASLGGSEEAFGHTQMELGVNAGVVVALVIGLVLIRRTEAADRD